MCLDKTEMNRRQALRKGLVLGASAAAASTSMAAPRGRGIAEIRLQTAKLDALERFYRDDLGLPVKRLEKRLEIRAGLTRIRFDDVAASDDAPFYHFAFNIPENKLESARRWQKRRTPLIRRGNQEVIHFRNWNAHSVFFNDPAGNILEYIARHDLDNAANGDFSPADMLYASEIGLVVDDVPETVDAVKQQLKLGVYRGMFNAFAPLGDAHALLILVKRNRLWTPDKTRAAKVHPVRATIRGERTGSLNLKDLGCHIDVLS